jgi:hypothetical protein
MALLPTEAFDFRDRDAGDADFVQRLSHVVELERLDDCSNQFHAFPPSWNLSDWLLDAGFVP